MGIPRVRRVSSDGRRYDLLFREHARIASGLEPVAWRRGSTKQDRELPMAGEVGTLYLEGPLDPLLPLLALGERIHVGARTSFGQGRYRLRVIA